MLSGIGGSEFKNLPITLNVGKWKPTDLNFSRRATILKSKDISFRWIQNRYNLNANVGGASVQVYKYPLRNFVTAMDAADTSQPSLVVRKEGNYPRGD